jgi:hypothetical protein
VPPFPRLVLTSVVVTILEAEACRAADGRVAVVTKHGVGWVGNRKDAPTTCTVEAPRCATDVGRSHRGPGLLSQPFVGRLASQTAVRSVEIVEVLPLAEALVEDPGVIDHDAIEHPVELLGVDPFGGGSGEGATGGGGGVGGAVGAGCGAGPPGAGGAGAGSVGFDRPS